MNAQNHQSFHQIKTAALRGTREAHHPDDFEKAKPNTFQDAMQAATNLRQFIGRAQLRLMLDLCRGEEDQFFIDKLMELAGIVASMPTTYETDGQGGEAVVWLHYFTPSADWHIVERDMEREQLQAFGKADLFGDGGEIGYINLVELLECGAELDLHWQPKSLNNV